MGTSTKESLLAVHPLKRASRKGTVHLSKMTSAFPMCSPKDLCCEEKKERERGREKVIVEIPFCARTAFFESGNLVATKRCPVLFSARRTLLGVGSNDEGNIHYPTFIPARRHRRIMSEEVSRLENLKKATYRAGLKRKNNRRSLGSSSAARLISFQMISLRGDTPREMCMTRDRDVLYISRALPTILRGSPRANKKSPESI